MAQLNLVVRTAMENSAVSVVEASGSLDLNTVEEFETVFNNLFREQKYRIILDLSQLEYISSAGIGILVGNIKEIRKNRGDIRMSHVNPAIYKVFELLDLPKLFHFYPSEREAALAF
jgi:anti-sigma B factor antagonist